jgi:hypothetical protein
VTEPSRPSARGVLTSLVLACLTAGCADRSGVTGLNVALYPVKGRVLLPDGKPLGAGAVEFVLVDGPAISSAGELTPDGSFALETEGVGSGAPAGAYRVRVVPPADAFTTKTRRHVKATFVDARKLPYDSKYLDEDASGLKVTVRPQDNLLEPIRLTR